MDTIEMAPVYLNSAESIEEQNLLTQTSFNSIGGRDNEITITRSFGNRKYSVMSFKKSAEAKNTIDIVVTKGEYQDGKDGREKISLHDFTSQDIRQKNSVKAKLLVSIVIFLLLAMVTLMVVALVMGQRGHEVQRPSDGTGMIGSGNVTDNASVQTSQAETIVSSTQTMLRANRGTAAFKNVTMVTELK